jgi:hypothetical protein
MSNTINSGTILIEENAFTAKFLRFESEPWTRFYMAGEIIRESQKASGKQSHYASDGNSEAQVIEETECKTFGCGSATGPFPSHRIGQGQDVEETLAIKNTNIVREFSLPPVQSCPMAQDTPELGDTALGIGSFLMDRLPGTLPWGLFSGIVPAAVARLAWNEM